MGGGGPMSFLNSKSWHTGGMKQRAAVWEKEQEQKKEDARVRELQLKVEEERAQQQLDRDLQAGGHAKAKVERVDFMYNTPMVARDDPLPAAAPAAAKAEEASKVERITAAPSIYQENTVKSNNEVWSRLNNDPLLAIRRREQEMRKEIVQNPVKMQMIKGQVNELRAQVQGYRHRERSRGKDRDDRDAGARGSRERRRHRHRSREEGGEGGSRYRRRHRHSRRSPSRSPEGRAPRAGRERSRSPERSRRRRRSPTPERREFRPDDASAQGRGAQYGLSFKGGADGGGTKTSFKLQEGLERKAEEDKHKVEHKAWSYGGKKKHVTGKLSAAEKAKRLAEMMGNAEVHEDQRWDRIQNAKRKDAAEAPSSQQNASKFMSGASKDMYDAAGGLAERVGSKKFYSQKQRPD